MVIIYGSGGCGKGGVRGWVGKKEKGGRATKYKNGGRGSAKLSILAPQDLLVCVIAMISPIQAKTQQHFTVYLMFRF